MDTIEVRSNVYTNDFWFKIEQFRKEMIANRTLMKIIKGLDNQTVSLEDKQKREVDINRVVQHGIEKLILNILEQISTMKVPSLKFVNRKTWNNVKYEPYFGLKLKDSKLKCTTISLDRKRSVKKFTLVLVILSKIYLLIQRGVYATKRPNDDQVFTFIHQVGGFLRALLNPRIENFQFACSSSSFSIVDIYYESPNLFEAQSNVDEIVDDISCLLKVQRLHLHVLACSKGLVIGSLSFYDVLDNFIDCRSNYEAMSVPSVMKLRNLSSDAKFILIVEKEATFQTLLQAEVHKKLHPCIIITGKGFPDQATRSFAKLLWDRLEIPVMALVDADPYGIEIMCTYKYGSKAMSFDTENSAIPDLKWIGILPTDILNLKIKENFKLEVTKRDAKKIEDLMKKPFINNEVNWITQLKWMKNSGFKAEIQALTSISSNYLTNVYLPNKIRHGGWI